MARKSSWKITDFRINTFPLSVIFSFSGINTQSVAKTPVATTWKWKNGKNCTNPFWHAHAVHIGVDICERVPYNEKSTPCWSRQSHFSRKSLLPPYGCESFQEPPPRSHNSRRNRKPLEAIFCRRPDLDICYWLPCGKARKSARQWPEQGSHIKGRQRERGAGVNTGWSISTDKKY